MKSNQVTSNLKDYEVNIKIKLSALWTSVTLCYLYGDYFELYVPEKVEGLINGANVLDHPLKLLAASLLLAIPATMVFLSVLLKPLINRWLNMIFGVLYTAMMLLIAWASITPWLAFYVFFALVESVITALIFWYAYTWPKQSIMNQ